MLSNRFGFLLVGVACVAAAGGGSYLATRQQNQSSAALAAPASAPAPVAAPSAAPATAPEPAVATVAPPTVVPAPEPPRMAAPVAPPEPKNKKTPVATVARNAAPPSARVSAQSLQTPIAPAPDATPIPAPAPEVATRQEEVRAPEPPRPVEPERVQEKTFDELVVSADSVIGLQLETALTSERARVEDRVEARVVRDVRVGSHVAIPAGSRVVGSVMIVEKGGKFKERARLGIRFNTLVLAGGARVPITTEMIYRYGEPPSNNAAGKIGGGAVIGTILGGILGGGKGAAVGAAAGAGAGAASAANDDRSAAEFPAGMQMTARFLAPVAVTVER